MDSDAWLRDEPRATDVLRRVVWRALRRPLLVGGITLAVVAVLAGPRVLGAGGPYVATAVVRMSEVLRSQAAPTPPGEMRNYIETVVLNRARLEEIMRTHRLIGGAPATDKKLELFRERVEIGIGQNTFLEYDDEGPRSAVLTFEFAAADDEVAAGVLHDVVAAVIETTEASRAERAEAGRAALDEARAQARAKVRELDDEIGRLAREPAKVRFGPMANLEFIKRSFLLRVQALERQAAESDLAAGAERTGLGLDFEIVDEKVQRQSEPLSLAGRVLLVLALIAAVLPLVLIVVGAFDRRLYGRDDLAAAGVPILGVLPRFSGDAVGSYRDRRRRAT